ncbi:MAG TPA: GNAT family N-acetyltransferase [Mycobacteriales bacterium]|nr:GNAT family N-acetyltransferase [Mycobacteriales bacterium]
MIRPMAPEDVPALVDVQYTTFDDLAARLGEPRIELTHEVVARGTARIGHLQRTDPDSAWTAEVDGEPVGCALALVREGMWFLSLLVVKPGYQGKGIGRELLDASLTTATDRSWIMSTVEPAAVRRYQRAGFALHPTYTAKGLPDRSQLPAVTGIREATEDDRDTFDQVLRTVRGAAMGPEVGYFEARGLGVVVAPGKGFAVLRKDGTPWLAATDEATARDLLWTVLAESTEPVEIDWMGADQQWAIDVCLDAHLTLTGGASLALRGQPSMSPYLPCGAFG